MLILIKFFQLLEISTKTKNVPFIVRNENKKAGIGDH